MLSARGATLGLVAAALLAAGPARADDDPSEAAFRRPERLTVGVADDLLSQLSPDAKTIYFVSNRNTSNQIFSQSLVDGRAHQLFDDDADVTWPRISPDGRELLYISYRDAGAGRLCIRRLPGAEGRRCVEGAGAAIQAEWIDSGRIALLRRESVEGELSVVEVRTRPTFALRPLLARSLTSPAVSPDGRWMVYVPVERIATSVGPGFAAHAASQLEVVELGRDAAVPLRLDLPGQTGQPAFARDGRWLYFAQFITDTNHDGVVDASDRAVLFRVPVDLGGVTPTLGAPQQLTETSWNCQYPAAFADQVLVTCSRDGSLDVYSLPLDGEVPAAWTGEELDAAAGNASSLVEQQLLASRRLALNATGPGRWSALLALAMVHLESEEFRAAGYYLGMLEGASDATTAGVGEPLQVLVQQRQESRRREQGRMMGAFAPDARKRLEAARSGADRSPLAQAVAHLVRSEIADSVGDKALARRELEAVAVGEGTPEPIVAAYHRGADALYRELDDPDALASACRKLGSLASLSADERLRYFRAAARATVRGLSFPDVSARLASEQRRVVAGSEEDFALQISGLVTRIRDAHPDRSVVDGVMALYAGASRPGRRRALVTDVVRRAEAVGAQDVLEALAVREIAERKPGSRDRPNAERLYRRLKTARAYLRASQKRFPEALVDFDDVARETRSYEALVGAIDMRMRNAEAPDSILSSYATKGTPSAMARFAEAYVLARQLPKLEGEAHAKAVARARAALMAAWPDLKGQRIAQALFGALLHEQYIVTEDRSNAERADFHYLVALALMGQNARFKAMILGELGILHADVGNYRIGLGYLLERDKLPYVDNAEGLDVRLSLSETLLHVGREDEAARQAELAIQMLPRNPNLGRYRLFALDWAALTNLAARHFDRALALYDEEVPAIDAEGAGIPERARVVTRLARAAAAVGAGASEAALGDLDFVAARLNEPRVRDELRWQHATTEHTAQTYRLIVSGLRARAYRQLGRLQDEAAALESRLGILESQFVASARAEVMQDELLTAAELAINAAARQDERATARWLGRALSLTDGLREREPEGSLRGAVDIALLAADLSVSMRAAVAPDLAGRLDRLATDLAHHPGPDLAAQRRWIEVYLPLIASSSTPARAAVPPLPSNP